MKYHFDDYMWTEDRKIITGEYTAVPGMEMFGHDCTVHNLHILKPHIHKTAEFVYLANGTQKYCIGDQEYTIKGNQVMVVDAQVPHSSGVNPYGRYESFWFRLDIQTFAECLGVPGWIKSLICSRLTNLQNPILAPKENLFGLLHDVFYDLSSVDPAKQLRGYSGFVGFITKLVECTDLTGGCSASIQRVLAYIEENICTHLKLEDLAELAGVSLSGFKQKFRRETGITPREYINLLKIEKAKEYLSAGYSVTETAFALDFSSSSYFSVLFRQMEDTTPDAYRRQCINAKQNDKKKEVGLL